MGLSSKLITVECHFYLSLYVCIPKSNLLCMSPFNLHLNIVLVFQKFEIMFSKIKILLLSNFTTNCKWDFRLASMYPTLHYWEYHLMQRLLSWCQSKPMSAHVNEERMEPWNWKDFSFCLPVYRTKLIHSHGTTQLNANIWATYETSGSWFSLIKRQLLSISLEICNY